MKVPSPHRLARRRQYPQRVDTRAKATPRGPSPRILLPSPPVIAPSTSEGYPRHEAALSHPDDAHAEFSALDALHSFCIARLAFAVRLERCAGKVAAYRCDEIAHLATALAAKVVRLFDSRGKSNLDHYPASSRRPKAPHVLALSMTAVDPKTHRWPCQRAAVGNALLGIFEESFVAERASA